MDKTRKRLIKKYPSLYQFCKGNITKFVLLLRKGVYPYEHLDSWKRYGEKSLLDKKYFYSDLNNEDTRDTDYQHYQKVWEVFKIKNLGEYHDLYSDIVLLADVLENFRDNCIEIYKLDPDHFLSAFGLAWQAFFKKT